MAIKTTNIAIHVVATRDDNELLKQIALSKKTSVSKLCKNYILNGMKKDLKEVMKNEK